MVWLYFELYIYIRWQEYPGWQCPWIPKEDYKMKYLSFAVVLIVAVATGLAEANDSTVSRSSFSGEWVHVGDSKEAKQRRQAIDAVIKDMPSFIRNTARKRLDEQTSPPPELKLKVEGDRIEISRDGNTVSLRIGAEPITMKKNGKKGKLSVKFEGDRIVVVSEGEKGKGITKYGLSPNQKFLTMSVHMTGERLSGPLVFQSTYRRK
jgi:hypothetical protein